MSEQEILGEINAYKILLHDSDYQAIKFTEYAISEEEYAPIRKKRQEWRNKINELEKILEEPTNE